MLMMWRADVNSAQQIRERGGAGAWEPRGSVRKYGYLLRKSQKNIGGLLRVPLYREWREVGLRLALLFGHLNEILSQPQRVTRHA